jgi:hypothetical protein
MEKVDKVFEEAVKRGIVLRECSLDSQWDTDLSGLSFPVARAACRYLIRRALRGSRDGKELDDISMITGGAHQLKWGSKGGDAQNHPPQQESSRKIRPSLRDYVQEVLETDFEPPISSSIPQLQQGTVVVLKEPLMQWIEKQPR